MISGSSRGFRGGDWDSDFYLLSSFRNYGDPTGEFGSIGFRVASVPEPTSMLLSMLTSVVMFARRKR